jgi:uncharacterized protein YfeS
MTGPRRYRDVRAATLTAPPDVVWRAVLDQVEVLGQPSWYVHLIGCRDRRAAGPRPLAPGSVVPGFRITTADPAAQLVLDGVHRFSVYTLTFHLAPDGVGTRLEAHTDAIFPGVLGAIYRLLVIDSRIHKVATRSIVARIQRRVQIRRSEGLGLKHPAFAAHFRDPIYDEEGDDLAPFGSDEGWDLLAGWGKRTDELSSTSTLAQIVPEEFEKRAVVPADLNENDVDLVGTVIGAGFTLLRLTGQIDEPGRALLFRALDIREQVEGQRAETDRMRADLLTFGRG